MIHNYFHIGNPDQFSSPVMIVTLMDATLSLLVTYIMLSLMVTEDHTQVLYRLAILFVPDGVQLPSFFMHDVLHFNDFIISGNFLNLMAI